MTDLSNPHKPTGPTGLPASPWPDVPALPAGPTSTDYPSGGYPSHDGPYAPSAPPGYDSQGAYGSQPGCNTPPGHNASPGYGPAPTYGPPGYPSESKAATGILALFLGTFGIRSFYLGCMGKAFFQLLSALLSCGSLTLPIAIWAFIRDILILAVRPGEASQGVDAPGMPPNDWGAARVFRIPRAGIRVTPPGGPGIIGPVLLSDRNTRIELDAGRVALDPYDPEMIQSASINACLDRWFRLFDNHRYPVVDPAADQERLAHPVDVGADEPFVLHPGEFVLGATYERITLPDDVAARLEGRSSLGRLGLLTRSTAGSVDSGFIGHAALELSNVATTLIKLWPGMKVRQLCFFRLSSPAQAPYGSGATGSHYQGRREPTISRSHQSFHRTCISDIPVTLADGIALISQEKHL